jgi:Domain of unknown function (DUF5668)
MNCAYHPDQAAVAYCRTCGKALCANCTRPVRGIIYCEDCLGARMEGAGMPGSVPAAGFVQSPTPGVPTTTFQVAPTVAPPSSGSGPNPTVAGILAGFFPFGVGAVYTGQYAKGLAHLVIFGLLVAGCNAASNSSHGDLLGVICGVGLAFFYVYQIVDAVRSARALQAGLQPPDPYGLAATFGGGTKIEPSKAPIGAIVLIVIGGLFLLNTMGVNLGLDRLWPLILVGIGGWMFARNYGLVGSDARLRNLSKIEGFAAQHGNPALMQQAVALARCQCPRCRARRITGPVVLVTIGVLFLLETLGHLGFGRTWPILLLVIGAVQLLQHSASTHGHISFPPPGPAVPPTPGAYAVPANVPPPSSPPPAPPATSSGPGEVSHG